MIVRVKYWNDSILAYSGAEYTYRTDLPLHKLQKVIAPVGEQGEMKKAIVTAVNLPVDVISPSWADRVKKIREIDTGGGGA